MVNGGRGNLRQPKYCARPLNYPDPELPPISTILSLFTRFEAAGIGSALNKRLAQRKISDRRNADAVTVGPNHELHEQLAQPKLPDRLDEDVTEVALDLTEILHYPSTSGSMAS